MEMWKSIKGWIILGILVMAVVSAVLGFWSWHVRLDTQKELNAAQADLKALRGIHEGVTAVNSEVQVKSSRIQREIRSKVQPVIQKEDQDVKAGSASTYTSGELNRLREFREVLNNGIRSARSLP